MKIGLIGTGLMGYPMAERLIQGGFTLIVYNRTISKAMPLTQQGATVVAEPAAVLEQSTMVVVMLTDATAINDVLLSDAARPHLSGTIIIQMGTISPQQSCELEQRIVACNGRYLEAPVLGSIPQVREGILQIMVGSSKELFDQCYKLLSYFGSAPGLIGPVGTAMALKLALNQLIAALTNGFALSLGFAQRSGVDVDTFMSFVRESALYAPTYDKKLQRMLDRNFANPNFPSKHLGKDINLMVEAAQAVGLRTDGLEGVGAIVTDAIASGLADEDYSSLYNTVNPEDDSQTPT